jgi:competence protein ComEC
MSLWEQQLHTYRDKLIGLARDQRLLLGLTAAVVLIWAWAFWPRHPVLAVTFLDVRQGDCAFIRTPGGRTILIDAGDGGRHNGFDAGSHVVLPFLRRKGVRTLDLVVMTHPHDDHLGGMPAVLDDISARAVMDAGESFDTPPHREALRTSRRQGVRYILARRGQTATFPDGVKITVLNPDEGAVDDGDESAINDHSIVLRVTYGHASVLFDADAGHDAEEDILRTSGRIRSTVLKVGHHGSAEATSDLWLKAAKPRIAVISVGKHNSFGHPSRETLQRLADNGVRVFRTDRDGAVTITTDGENMHVETARR